MYNVHASKSFHGDQVRSSLRKIFVNYDRHFHTAILRFNLCEADNW